MIQACLVLCIAATARASFGLEQRKSLSIGGKSFKVLMRGAAEESSVSLEEVAVKGALLDDKENDIKVSFEASYDGGAGSVLGKVVAAVKGNSVTVTKKDSGYALKLEPQAVQGQAVSAMYEGGKLDYKLGVGVPSNLLDKVSQAIGGRSFAISPEVSLANKAGSMAITVDALKAEIDYELEGSKLGYKATYSTSSPLGSVKATLLPQSKVVSVQVTDDSIEEGASWKANLEIPFTTSPMSLTKDDLNLKIKRTLVW